MTPRHIMIAILASSLLLVQQVGLASERAVAVIAGPGVAEHRLSPETVTLIFQCKQILWPDGKRVQPVNLPATHPLRRIFSQSVLGRLPEEMESYWQEMFFHGVLPPHIVESEEAMILFVTSTPGAIGYVSACLVDPRIHVVLTLGDDSSCTK